MLTEEHIKAIDKAREIREGLDKTIPDILDLMRGLELVSKDEINETRILNQDERP